MASRARGRRSGPALAVPFYRQNRAGSQPQKHCQAKVASRCPFHRFPLLRLLSLLLSLHQEWLAIVCGNGTASCPVNMVNRQYKLSDQAIIFCVVEPQMSRKTLDDSGDDRQAQATALIFASAPEALRKMFKHLHRRSR